MSKREDNLLIEDILEAASNISEYISTVESYDDFVNDKKTIDAIVRNFEIIGEATMKLSMEFKSIHPIIEWREMSDFRNTLIHEYFGVDLEILWDVIQNDLKYNMELIKKLIK